MTVLGEKIRDRRKQLKFTLDELAEKAKCSKSYIWELENKNPPRPSADKLSAIANALKLPLEYFLSEEITEESAEDEMFYRNYRKKPAETKEKIRKMMDLWDD